MWSGFFLSWFVGGIILYLPGTLALSLLGNGLLRAICFAPLFSIGFYSIGSVVLSLFSVSVSWFALFCIPCALLITALLVRTVFFKDEHSKLFFFTGEKKEEISCLIALCVSLLIVGFYFVKTLDGPDSFFQGYDNTFHLGVAQSFVDTGNYSYFGVSQYVSLDDQSPFAIGSAGFYPAAWHCVVAMIADASGVSVAVASNALCAAILSFVVPLGFLGLSNCIFNNSRLSLISSIVSLAFPGFPWAFLFFGPLLPNLLGYSLIPAVTVLFIDCFKVNNFREALYRFILFLFGLATLAVCHPNAIFSLAVLLSPFVVKQFAKIPDHFGSGVIKRFSNSGLKVLFTLLGISFIAVIWILCYKHPSLQSVVSYHWSSIASIRQGFFNVIFLSMTERTNAALVLAFAVLIGAITLIRCKENGWIFWSYCFAAVIYYVNAAGGGEIKQILAGFWYTDPYRTAATVCIAGVMIASYGINSFAQYAISKLCNSAVRSEPNPSGSLFVLGIYSIIIIFLFSPSFDLNGIGRVNTPMGGVYDRLTFGNEWNNSKVLTGEEYDFANEVLSYIPEDALVINQPFDGSAFFYGALDMNTFYRGYGSYSNKDTAESELLRTGLDDIASDVQVQNAARSIGAQYVLLLDVGGERTGDRSYDPTYSEEEWVGLNSINEDTDGFEIVATEGDMMLLRIDWEEFD